MFNIICTCSTKFCKTIFQGTENVLIPVYLFYFLIHKTVTFSALKHCHKLHIPFHYQDHQMMIRIQELNHLNPQCLCQCYFEAFHCHQTKHIDIGHYSSNSKCKNIFDDTFLYECNTVVSFWFWDGSCDWISALVISNYSNSERK